MTETKMHVQKCCQTSPIKQSRSDYCLVSEDIFPLMECAKIILGYRTDHPAIVFSFSASPANQERTTGNKIPNY